MPRAPSADSISSRLPQIDPSIVHTINTACSAAGQISLMIGEEEFVFRAGVARAVWTQGWNALARTRQGSLYVSLATLEPFLPGSDRVASIAPGETRKILATHLGGLLAGLSAGSASISWRCAFGPVAPVARKPITIGFSLLNVRRHVRSLGLLATDNTACVAPLARWWRAHAEPDAARGVPVPVAFEIARIELSANTLRNLRPGDVVLLNQLPTLRGHWRIDALAGVKRQHIATCYLEGDHIVVAKRETGSSEVRVGADLEPLLDNVTVSVRFEMGAQNVALTELMHLAPGYVFDLGTNVEAAEIRVAVHNHTVALGQLVMVGDALGVRITRVAQSDTATAAPPASTETQPTQGGTSRTASPALY